MAHRGDAMGVSAQESARLVDDADGAGRCGPLFLVSGARYDLGHLRDCAHGCAPEV